MSLINGLVIILAVSSGCTKKQEIKNESNKEAQQGLAENGFPKTPVALKEYLAPLFKIGFKENLGLDPQASASIDVPETATVSCGYRFKDSKGKLAVEGKLQVSGGITWLKDPSKLENREKIQTMTTAACTAALLDKKIISESEFTNIALVTTTDQGIKKAMSNSGVPIGKKWAFNIIPTNPLEQMAWTLTEK